MFRIFNKKWQSVGYADFGPKRIYDSDVARFVWKHLKWKDRFSFSKIVEATLSSFAILSDSDSDSSGTWKFDL